MTNLEFLKETIDWKFFNFLKDKATKFEDEGTVITIFIIANLIGYIRGRCIYKYDSTGIDNFASGIYMDLIDKENVNYIYEIHAAEYPKNDHSKNIIDEYYELIKDKCILEYKSNIFIQIQPKNNTTND